MATAAEDVRDMRCTVLGAARSGIGAARLLRSRGARVLVSDQRPAEQLDEEARGLEHLGIALETGGHSDQALECSLLVLSPGVPGDAPVVMEALRRGIRVVSELEVAGWFCRSPIVAVTGSNGKTTTTTLIGRILGDAKKKHVVAGNIGTAFSSVVLELAETDLAVLEVSSFQLDFCSTFRPWISVILNITEDHMDRYDNSMERYAASKARIFMNQTAGDILVYSADDPWTSRTAAAARCRTLPFSCERVLMTGGFVENGMLVTSLGPGRHEIIPAADVSIRGVHNRYNALAAAMVGELAGVRVPSIRATLKNFKGVEHRLEFVREVRGVRYFNDSKATNVDSVRSALQAFDEPVILILGGRDKGNDYSRLFALVKKRVRGIIAIGESAGKVVEAFSSLVQVVSADSMERAVQEASRLAKQGDIVLLSPACASFDWFIDYEHRGRVFKEQVHQL